MQLPNLGFAYWLDLDEVKKNMVSFGVRTPKHRKVRWPSFPEYQAVGRWESEFYEPEEWRNDYPNPAFMRMTDRDAFWAAKTIMSFTRADLRAIVRSRRVYEPGRSRVLPRRARRAPGQERATLHRTTEPIG